MQHNQFTINYITRDKIYSVLYYNFFVDTFLDWPNHGIIRYWTWRKTRFFSLHIWALTNYRLKWLEAIMGFDIQFARFCLYMQYIDIESFLHGVIYCDIIKLHHFFACYHCTNAVPSSYRLPLSVSPRIPYHHTSVATYTQWLNPFYMLFVVIIPI